MGCRETRLGGEEVEIVVRDKDGVLYTDITKHILSVLNIIAVGGAEFLLQKERKSIILSGLFAVKLESLQQLNMLQRCAINPLCKLKFEAFFLIESDH